MTTTEAKEELQNGKNHIFLTGNAGTGKSTLIREFISDNIGRCIVLAPTGIAAVNIGGQTIHSFFSLPARTVSYNSIKFLDERNPLDYAKKKIIRKAKYLIIDEISMVRADLMDAISWFLHKNFRRGPFAHLKVIMIGDVNQLPPVIASEQEKEMLTKRYGSEFFFSAKCWNNKKDNDFEGLAHEGTFFKTIRLTKIWRQNDPEFIRILGDIKNNTLSSFDLDRLNISCCVHAELDPEMGIMLCTTNAGANMVNAEMLSRIEGERVQLTGIIKDNFDTKNCTVEPVIDLKVGCKVMTMRNGEGYCNGSVGTFRGQDDDSGDLVIKLSNGNVVKLPQHEFTSIEYQYDASEDRIICAETGKFIQYPVKLAYAITIHKSQGATFDSCIIDLGEKGAFAHGQVCVALSRCTSMKGITLRFPINRKDLIYSKAVLDFNARAENVQPEKENIFARKLREESE